MDNRRPRKVIRTPRFRRELTHLLANVQRGDDALEGFEEVVSRIPEQGMAAPGMPDCCARPLHTTAGSFLIVYSFSDEEVYLLSLRSVPEGRF